MKKIIFSLTLLLFVLTSFEQTNPDPKFSKDYYLKKAKKQKTTGFILFGTGSAMVVGTLIKFNNANKKHESVNEIIWVFVVTGGIAADIVSIPWFISAAKNKKRAATVAITSQKILWYKKNNIGFITQPSFTMRIGL